MKKGLNLRRTLAALVAATFVCMGASSMAAESILFEENFESPVVTGYAQNTLPDNGNWVGATQGFGSNRRGLLNKDSGNFDDVSDPGNLQVYAFRYTNSGITTASGVIGNLTSGATYTITFEVVLDGGLNDGTPYTAQLIAFDAADPRNDCRSTPPNSTLLASASGNAPGDGSFATVTLSFSPDDVTHAAQMGMDLGLRFKGGTTSACIDNVKVVAITPGPEIVVIGNSTTIESGDSTPSTADDTDFGPVVSGGSSAKTFTIENTGDQDLTLGGAPVVAISGGEFTVTTQATTPVAAAGSTTFVVTFSPTSAGAQTATVSIANNDADENPYTFDVGGTGVVPTLTVTIDSASISENGGSSTATVTRNTGTSGPLTVNLASDTPTEATVPTSVTINDGSDSATFTITGVDEGVADGTQTVTITASSAGYNDGTDTIDVTDDDAALTVTIDSATFSENGGSSTATVTRNSDTTASLTVNLVSDDINEATVPASVTIGAGNASTTFTVTGVDDGLVDGTKTVTITASATDHKDGTDTVDVTDDDVPTLTVTIDSANFSENGGSSTATVSRNTDTGSDLVVNLASDDTGEATVPASVTIGTGNADATFTITGVDEFWVDGTQTVTITASAGGFADGTDTVDVTDDDVAGLLVVIDAASIGENGQTTTATVTRNTDTSAELIVNLASDDIGEATVPTTVTIGAGNTDATFTITGVQDAITDGTQTATITASAAGLADGTDTVDVLDDDVTVTLSVDNASIAENGGLATVTATLSSESPLDVTVYLSYAGTADGSGVDYTESTDTFTITAGSTTETVTVTGVDDPINEGPETVLVDILSLVNATDDGLQEQTITITDDDSPPTVTLGVNAATIAESGGIATFTATLSNPSGLPVTITLGFGGTATKDTDYVASAETIVVPAGSTVGAITVTGQPDLELDPDETVIVDITGVTNGSEDGVQTQTVTLNEVIILPDVVLTTDKTAIMEDGRTATITATLSEATVSDVTIDLAYSGTASGGGTDYTASGTQIVIPIGSVSGTVTITSVDNRLRDGDRTVVADIVAVSNANESATQRVIITIRDDEPRTYNRPDKSAYGSSSSCAIVSPNGGIGMILPLLAIMAVVVWRRRRDLKKTC